MISPSELTFVCCAMRNSQDDSLQWPSLGLNFNRLSAINYSAISYDFDDPPVGIVRGTVMYSPRIKSIFILHNLHDNC